MSLGIPGTPFTLGKLVVLVALLVVLLYLNRRFTRWVVDSFLAGRNLDIGVRQAVGTLLRYAITTVGVIVILQAVGIDITAFTVLAGAVGVGIGFGLQNVASNFVSGLIILLSARSRWATAWTSAGSAAKSVGSVPAPRPRDRGEHRGHRPQLPVHLRASDELEPHRAIDRVPGPRARGMGRGT